MVPCLQWGFLNEKDNRDCGNLFGANVFSGYGPGTHRRCCAWSLVGRTGARTGWRRSRRHRGLYRGTVDCECLGCETIKFTPEAVCGGAKSKCKVQLACNAK